MTAGLGAALVLAAARGEAQERLIERRSLGVGGSSDVVSFRGDGLFQAGFADLDSVRVTGLRQTTLPVAVATALGGGWRLDVTALFAQGRVTYHDASTNGAERTATLSGMSDVRQRATGRLLSDALTLTVGVNAPSGRTDLSSSQFSALKVLAAPALALGSTPVGSGPSGTLGLVFARQGGPWNLAFGASYEHRGTYQPVAALTAGAPSTDFRPGGVIRASFGAERTVGPHRLALALATDVFAEDHLRGSLDASGGTPDATIAAVKLGPVFTGDAQLQVASQTLRDVVVYGSWLWRAAYARDGVTAEGTSGTYLETGARAAYPLRPRTDLVFGTGLRWHSGLGVDEGLTTSGVRSADVTVGLRAQRGVVSVQPFVRAQGGSLRARSASDPDRLQSFGGVTTGLVLQTRF
jgi:hypothetical protein